MIISHLLLVLGAAVLSAALRSFQNPLLFRLGTLGIVATSFLAGWLLGGSVAFGAVLAASWLFLPWLEILTKVRRLRLPIERRLEPRAPPTRNSFPDFEEMTAEIESDGYVHLEDVGWDYEETPSLLPRFPSTPQQNPGEHLSHGATGHGVPLPHHYIAYRGRTRLHDVELSLFLRFEIAAAPLHQPIPWGGPFVAMHTAHEQFLRSREVNPSDPPDPSPEETIRTMQNEMRAQITHNIALGLLVQDGDHFIRYTMRGMVYLWFQFLRDLVRLS